MKHLISIIILLVILSSCNFKQWNTERKCNKALEKISKLESKKASQIEILTAQNCQEIKIPKGIENTSDTITIKDTLKEVVIDEGFRFWCNEIGLQYEYLSKENRTLLNKLKSKPDVIFKTKFEKVNDSTGIFSIQAGCKEREVELTQIINNQIKEINEVKYQLETTQKDLKWYEQIILIAKWIGGIILLLILLFIILRKYFK